MGQWARILLAEANDATLLMTEPVAVSEPATLTHDEGGVPHLWCVDGSNVAAAARRHRPAVLTVAARRSMYLPVTLVLIGQLGYLRSTYVGERCVDAMALTPARVSIDVGREPELRTHQVPLDDFLTHTPDRVTDYAARPVEHTNSRHQRELCAYVSYRFGLPEAVIAGALLTSVDRNGATLRWVDAAGAHTTRLAFDRPAAGAADLVNQLRSELSGSGQYGRDDGRDCHEHG
jgi:hypothetical protein